MSEREQRVADKREAPSDIPKWVLDFGYNESGAIQTSFDRPTQHKRNCGGDNFDRDCTCALIERQGVWDAYVALGTERELHNAWRKRADEAEAELRSVSQALDEEKAGRIEAERKAFVIGATRWVAEERASLPNVLRDAERHFPLAAGAVAPAGRTTEMEVQIEAAVKAHKKEASDYLNKCVALMKERDASRDLLRDIALSGIEHDGARGYVTVQISRDTWAALRDESEPVVALAGRDATRETKDG